MKLIINDGGRQEAGFKGVCGDCVVRAVAIVGNLPYKQVYEAFAVANQSYRGKKSKGKRTARNGVFTQGAAFKRTMDSFGFKFTPTMGIGTGCTVHLHDGELPNGRLVVSLSRHYTAVIDGEVYDIFDPQRNIHIVLPDNGRELKPGEWRNVNGIQLILRSTVVMQVCDDCQRGINSRKNQKPKTKQTQ